MSIVLRCPLSEADLHSVFKVGKTFNVHYLFRELSILEGISFHGYKERVPILIQNDTNKTRSNQPFNIFCCR